MGRQILFFIAFLFLVLAYITMMTSSMQAPEITFSEFERQVQDRQVKKVYLQGRKILVEDFQENRSYTYAPSPLIYQGLVQMLMDGQVEIQVEAQEGEGLFLMILTNWLPIFLIIGVLVYVMRQMQGGNKVMNFGKSKAKEQDAESPKVTFADVAGIEESKAELDEIVEFLKDPSKFEKLGGKIPTGVLLVGEPGTGKTLLAKAIAGEAGVSFFSISGSDFVEMFVGVGASRVRDLFAQARAKAPCIIFIDEIDAVGRHRGAGLGGGNDEREQTLNQLLVEMDGFGGNEGVIVIAATNRPDVLDQALTRPGRFDRQVVVPRPDTNGRHQILKVHSKNIELSEDVDLKIIAQATPGFTGADLANLCNESALGAARLNKQRVEMSDFEEARDRIMMGKERRSMVVKEKEKRITAYHEAGHAIIAALLEEVDPVHRVTIVPRGRALGVTMLLPQEDKNAYNKKQLQGMLAMMMGGRAAEELIFNHFTTGASNDLERSSQLAHRMVCDWGMSEKIGPRFLSASSGDVFLGRDIMRKRHLSQKTTTEIDREVNRIVNEAYAQAMKMLKENMDVLHKVTERLIKEETIDGKAIEEILAKTA